MRKTPGYSVSLDRTLSVMPGLVPGIHVFLVRPEDVDGRDKPGHDEEWTASTEIRCGKNVS